MVTRRDPKDGHIRVDAKTFTVVVEESGLKVMDGDEVIHQWQPGPNHSDMPSPRSKAARRGSR